MCRTTGNGVGHSVGPNHVWVKRVGMYMWGEELGRNRVGSNVVECGGRTIRLNTLTNCGCVWSNTNVNCSVKWVVGVWQVCGERRLWWGMWGTHAVGGGHEGNVG